MPELFAIFLLGSILSLITGLIMLFLQLAKYRSDRFLMVQKNLQKIDLRWNDLEGGTEPVAARSTENEIARARTTYILCCLFAMMFSWAGFFVLLLIWVSIKKLIVNKLEKQLFTSELALLELDRAQVFQKVQSLQKA